jgi:photosystem II stability/assembly factor-like uncharacterized protein
LFSFFRIIILLAFLAACSPPETYPLIDAVESAGSPLSVDNPNQEGNPQDNKINAQPLWISEMKMFDRENGWALDDLGRILRTNEGVELWKDVSPAQPVPKTYINTAFININRAVVVYYTPDTDKFESWITEDGGTTWLQGNPIPGGFPGILTPVELFFLNNRYGWFAAYFDPGINGIETLIYETIDGGVTWELVHNSLPHNDSQDMNRLTGSMIMTEGNMLYFIGRSRGFAGNGTLFQTVDGGRNWEQVYLYPPDETLLVENSFIYISAPSFLTESAGISMMTVFNTEQATPIPGALLPPPIANFLFFTYDGGNTWIGKEAPALIGKASFITPNTGWFLGKDDQDPNVLPRLYKTIDDGDTWQIINETALLPIGTKLLFINELEGFGFNPFVNRQENVYSLFDHRAGKTPYLYRTTDGGYTWEEVEPFLAFKKEKSPNQP